MADTATWLTPQHQQRRARQHVRRVAQKLRGIRRPQRLPWPHSAALCCGRRPLAHHGQARQGMLGPARARLKTHASARNPRHTPCTLKRRMTRACREKQEFGADADARDGTGCTPMHVAAAKHESEAARILWRMGADVNARDNAGFTPVERALEAGANDTALLLVHACGAKLFDGLDVDHDACTRLKHGTAHEAAPLQTPVPPLAPRAAVALKAEVARVMQRLEVAAARLKAEALLCNDEGEIDYNVPSVDGHGPAPIDVVGQRAGSAEAGQRNSGRKGRSRSAKGKKKQSTSRGQSGKVNRRDRDGSVVRRQLQVARTCTHMHTHTQRNAHAPAHPCACACTYTRCVVYAHAYHIVSHQTQSAI